jgi:transcriptional regulator GlxA family with amidase domain
VKIQIILFEGFDELDAIAPFEVLQTAAAIGVDIQTELVTLDGAGVVAAHGLRVGVDAKLDLGQDLDLLIVPGGGWSNHATQGAWAQVQQGEIPAAIAHLHQRGTTIASVCTGAMLVAAAGLLKGRPATTHHDAIADLSAAGANIIPARVVDDGDILTAGGVTSGLDLTLWLVEKYGSPQLARAVEQEMEYHRQGEVWHQG